MLLRVTGHHENNIKEKNPTISLWKEKKKGLFWFH